MTTLDQPTLACKINDAVDRYRAKKQKLAGLEREIEANQESGEEISEALTKRLARAQELLAKLATALVRMQNDYLRVHLGGGQLMMTAGVHARGPDFVARAIAAVRSFNTFTRDNDPYGEHDFGAFEVDGSRLFFKIDAYDRDMRFGSPDTADPALTSRVMTIMLAEEY